MGPQLSLNCHGSLFPGKSLIVVDLTFSKFSFSISGCDPLPQLSLNCHGSLFPNTNFSPTCLVSSLDGSTRLGVVFPATSLVFPAPNGFFSCPISLFLVAKKKHILNFFGHNPRTVSILWLKFNPIISWLKFNPINASKSSSSCWLSPHN